MTFVGHSQWTSTKQAHLKEILTTHLKIVKAILRKNNHWAENHYFYVDAYSGPGWSDDAPGSPLIFVDLASSLNIPFLAEFIDINPDACESLQDEIDHFGDSCKVSCMDADAALRELSANQPKLKQYGMLYLDPNGIPTFDGAVEFFKASKYSMMDLLVYCPAAAVKRAKGNDCCKQELRLDEELERINKAFWLIRDPLGTWQWTFLLGSNWDKFPQFEHLGFHRLTEPDGLRVFERLSYTAEERKEFSTHGYYEKYNYREFLAHPITRIIFRERKARAKYKCQQCHGEWAGTDNVHHLIYPNWDDHCDITKGFDRQENLLPVCYRCHCILEGKER
jgi:three-Cys-motif partner protein